GHRTPDTKEQTKDQRKRHKLRRFRVTGTARWRGRRDHTGVADLEGRRLVCDLRFLKKVLEQALVDRRRSLEFAERDRRLLVDAALACCFSQGLLEGVCAGLDKLILVADTRG